LGVGRWTLDAGRWAQKIVATCDKVFTVAAGILPAVEPGILPGGNGAWSGKALAIWRLRPGGKKMPSSTAAKMAVATPGPHGKRTHSGRFPEIRIPRYRFVFQAL